MESGFGAKTRKESGEDKTDLRLRNRNSDLPKRTHAAPFTLIPLPDGPVTVIIYHIHRVILQEHYVHSVGIPKPEVLSQIPPGTWGFANTTGERLLCTAECLEDGFEFCRMAKEYFPMAVFMIYGGILPVTKK